ncbi:PREDICTED: esterase FE4-like [Papilio xuthus]|uniref:Carboxylic ester hydrolase n=1 Tax=Papilio xuthus TaxID=66420 RepID=A0AAJ7E507_PAPXU|nr:PREDICTED: esterase FE4-like [Papilio xuthus]
MRRQWLVLWSLWAARLVPQHTPEVKVSGGLLRGVVAPDGSHRQYLSIPYATVGPHNRFQAADPEPTWNGVFDAVNENVRCPQRKGKSFVTGQENCLTLNVFTPLEAGQAGESLPVMVFIHGGGFYDGSSSRHVYGPQYLVTKGVILVTINYRLNLQGFACLRIKEAPGNAGLKDQVAALKWIQRNIGAFGGDADNVTIFGESAGASSVSYHVVSPMSAGLFHKAILQSGSSLAPWAIQYRPIYTASLMAKVMGYKTEDPREIYDIFHNKSDAELIVTRVPRLEGNVILSECLYVPCVEDRIEGVEPFLIEYPYDMYRRGHYNKVPMIIGFNSEEGYLFAGMENDTTIPKIKIEKSFPKDLTFPTEEERRRVAEHLHRMYFGDEGISQETLLQLAKFQGEAYFVNAVIEETEYLLETNDKPVYSYIFGYGGNRNLAKIFSGEPYRSAPGASHADDLFYLFSQGVLPALFENKMIDTMTTLWTNFAKFGEPTPMPLPAGAGSTEELRWSAADGSEPRALLISEELRMTPLRYTETLKFWKTVYSKYRRKKPLNA